MLLINMCLKFLVEGVFPVRGLDVTRYVNIYNNGIQI